MALGVEMVKMAQFGEAVLGMSRALEKLGRFTGDDFVEDKR